MFPDFLNKADKRKFLFVQYLEKLPTLSEDKEVVMADLAMSSFLFYKTIDELHTDFNAFGLAGEYHIYLEGNIVKLTRNGLVSADLLFSHYLEDSLKYCMFKECFFERLVSVYEFAAVHFFSHNPIYKEFKALKKLLLDFDIKINKEFQLIGDEWVVREFLFVFFLRNKEKINELFPSLSTESVKKFTLIFDDPSFLYPSDTRMSVKLALILNIIAIRVKHGHHLGNARPNGLLVPVEDPLLNKISQWVYDINPIQEKHICQVEAEGIAQFLISEGLIDGSIFASAGRPEVAEMNHRFLDNLVECFPVSAQDFETIEKELYGIHYLVLSFPPTSTWQYLEADISFFVEDYPEFSTFSRAFIEMNLKLDFNSDDAKFLFHHYLTLLVSVVSVKGILDPIKTCVDFSYGEKYNRILQQNIAHFIDTPMQFQLNPDETTELIISDILIHDADKSVLVQWSTPPKQSDWEGLKERVLDIRKNRIEQAIACLSDQAASS
ncbi:hypothetical protein A5886_001045 [Enterococcus sp. 8G7_MSG3316]|uniref:Mga helix-turn-helix domain-containing protein n=1 Tax=Candidatus Enterococcus testudinis TaxID=1834191 RepID=A0A242A4X6_9ENTE|nr:helix-turn-helix domain-containing protein [Enterococcus sp. 8G7_MSG3316]OTN75969.1 hypothetical protein A5886_001045 [Enterococcus sp. 8G7_MSG3316]